MGVGFAWVCDLWDSLWVWNLWNRQCVSVVVGGLVCGGCVGACEFVETGALVSSKSRSGMAGMCMWLVHKF